MRDHSLGLTAGGPVRYRRICTPPGRRRVPVSRLVLEHTDPLESVNNDSTRIPPARVPDYVYDPALDEMDLVPREEHGTNDDRPQHVGSHHEGPALAGGIGTSDRQDEEAGMHIAKNQIPAKIDVPGAVARQATDFGDATGFGKMGGEYFSLGAGTDIAPLLKGLEGDACQAPHWGYMISGEVLVTYTDGNVETCREHDLFFWPPGHSVRVVKDSDVVLFSPQREHTHVLEHMLNRMKG